ncbi:TlpA family protein disulfide reductase [Paenibacillus apiarius]|uniref:TlpA family protein disulfide reductase n=1 Tax=Paenibacillus apiarius TaxID=46240 RepID=A0ABT4E017_9BACL|nr:TlpA disulfide reductase family protein [Paenibacillus apiarius]MBN3522792.1 TlpA family protein disulfide reductase [Paenibacillus apiarius]MCY9515088.1 TlpA family protein disulfide reductase [Paenibacillus apiarius]MCY9522926.1 TlpA family protein disulfide reductase [Paenibacillus apiarius]MCY9553729.1 TlpA family protein disulfide reductase [Paenibacillus apiarius]MCY9556438.1 TlpA family protein disulfide reductase [Paenibacillus apiarius]
MKKSVLVLILGIGLICFGAWQNQMGKAKDTSGRKLASGTGAVLPTETGPQVGKLAPSFSLTSTNGAAYQVGGKQNKPIFINFWASWCDPCQAEAPDLVKLYAKYKDRMEMLSVNVTSYDSEDKAKAFVKEYSLVNPVLLDEKGDVFKLYNGIAFPTNVLVDKNGVIRELFIGLRPPKDLEQAIEKLIGE